MNQLATSGVLDSLKPARELEGQTAEELELMLTLFAEALSTTRENWAVIDG